LEIIGLKELGVPVADLGVSSGPVAFEDADGLGGGLRG
jgi:hypothetical protein